MMRIFSKIKGFIRRFSGESEEIKDYIIGQYSYGNPRILRFKGDECCVTIGKFCSIASEVEIFVGGNHNANWITTYPVRIMMNLDGKYSDGHPSSSGDVVIGNDVWIGRGATILSGCHIGDGAIIGARAVVAKDIPPYAIAVGNPVRVVKYRFDDEQIQNLLAIRWWDWELDKIKENTDLLCSPDIEQFICKHKLR